MTPRLSAIVCTHNRASYLESAILSLTHQQGLESDDLEIVVVNNASTDRTTAVIDSLSQRFPALRAIEESRLGLSHARNAGRHHARAPILAYIDDDATAHPHWGHRILDTFGDEPSAGCVGGPVRARWETSKPSWLSDAVSECFTDIDWGDKRIRLDEGRWLAGCNIAIRGNVLDQVGGFSTELGRVGTSLRSMEDIAVQRALRRIGRPIVYDPGISVEHSVLPERLVPTWVERRVYWNGVSSALLERTQSGVQPNRRRRLAWQMTTRLLSQPGDLAHLLHRSSDPSSFERRCTALGRIGFLRGLFGSTGT